jgi:hypothetical protein
MQVAALGPRRVGDLERENNVTDSWACTLPFSGAQHEWTLAVDLHADWGMGPACGGFEKRAGGLPTPNSPKQSVDRGSRREGSQK